MVRLRCTTSVYDQHLWLNLFSFWFLCPHFSFLHDSQNCALIFRIAEFYTSAVPGQVCVLRIINEYIGTIAAYNWKLGTIVEFFQLCLVGDVSMLFFALFGVQQTWAQVFTDPYTKRKEKNTYFRSDCMFNLSSLSPNCWTNPSWPELFSVTFGVLLDHVRSSSRPCLTCLCLSQFCFVLLQLCMSGSVLLFLWPICLLCLSSWVVIHVCHLLTFLNLWIYDYEFTLI